MSPKPIRKFYLVLAFLFPFLSLALILALLASGVPATTVVAQAESLEHIDQFNQERTSVAFVPDRLIIKFRNGIYLTEIQEEKFFTGSAPLDQLLVEQGMITGRSLFNPKQTLSHPGLFELSSIYVIQLKPGSNVFQVAEMLAENPDIAWAEPDYLAYAASTTTDTIPDDPHFNNQWGLDKIQAPAAWSVVTGTQNVVIAILDSGVDKTHPDLTGKLWVNPGETPGNGIDEDNNGFIDDVNGWDFVNSDNNPADDNGHGTQVAGIAAAVTDNATGIAGVCWNCKIMSVKVMQISGVANYSDIAAGVLYAAQKGAEVINLSLGGYSNSSALRNAVQAAVNTYGAVVVGGAGNDNINTPFYPAAYSEVIAVAGTTISDTKATYSNYGSWVDVSAPGTNITTTFLGGDYGPVNGTSYAAPFVSGLAGLIRSQHTDWSPDLVQAQIIRTADQIDDLNPTYEGLLGSGRVNANAAVSIAPHPILTIDSTAIDGDLQGRPTPGESSELQVSLTNEWLDAVDVAGTLTTADPLVTIGQDISSFGDIESGDSGQNTPVYTFTVDLAAGYNHSIPFELDITANGGAYSTTLVLTVTTRSANEPWEGTITEDTTWTNDKTYIINNHIGVAPEVTLTIQAGTVIKFNGNYDLNVGGTLIAEGTAAKPIRFMSNTGSDWGRIFFDNASIDAQTDGAGDYLSGNLLRYVQVMGAVNGIACDNATPFLANLTMDKGGINCQTGETPFSLASSTINGNVTVNQGTGAVYSSNTCMDLQSTSQSYWAKTYDFGAENITPKSIYPTSDGGYVIGAWFDQGGSIDYRAIVAKFGSNGHPIWQKSFVSVGRITGRNIVVPTNDSGYIMMIGGWVDDGPSYLWVLKLDQVGNILWQKLYGDSNDHTGESIRQTDDGGYIVVGTTNGEMWILKLDDTGNVQWQTIYSGNNQDYGWDVRNTSDSGYIVAGSTNSFGAGGEDVWIVKLNYAGDIEWQKTYGGSSLDRPTSIYQTSDLGFIVVGNTASFGEGSYDGWVVKIDGMGNIEWQKALGGSSNDYIDSVHQLDDGGYVLSGYTSSFGAGDYDGWILKLDKVGNILWQKTYGGISSDLSYGSTPNMEGTLVVGRTNSFHLDSYNEILVLKIDPQGNISNKCDLVSTSSAAIITTSASVTNTLAITNTMTFTPTVTSENIYNLGSIERTLCTSVPDYRIANTTINGILSLPDQADVIDSEISGKVTLGNLGEVEGTSTGGIQINGIGGIDNSISNGTITLNSGVVRNSTVTGGGITISSGSLVSNTVQGGGIIAGTGSTVQGNNIEDASSYAIQTSGNVTVKKNRLVGNGGGIKVAGGLVQGNLIANNSGIGLEINGNTTVVSNTFNGNLGNTIKVVSGTSMQITGNNLEGNKGTYDIENLVPKSIMMMLPAQYNWWATTSNAIIAKRIWDYNDDYNKGQVLYAPALAGPVQTAPAYIRSVTITPESPVGIEIATFDVVFSREMDQGILPLISFSNEDQGTLREFPTGNAGGYDPAIRRSVVVDGNNVYAGINATYLYMVGNCNSINLATNQTFFGVLNNGIWLPEDIPGHSDTIIAASMDMYGNKFIGTSDDPSCINNLVELDRNAQWHDFGPPPSGGGHHFSMEAVWFDTGGYVYVETYDGLTSAIDVLSPSREWLSYPDGPYSGEWWSTPDTIQNTDSDGNWWSLEIIDSEWHLVQQIAERTYSVVDNPRWISPAHFQAGYDINVLVTRGAYFLTIADAIGGDGLEIAPNSAYTFTVDYGGAIGDTTPPPAPSVIACSASTPDTLSAFWTANDPDSSITLYQYSIGTSPGGSDVVYWTNTTENSFLRSDLHLTLGQTYYISVRARNEGGLWSEPGMADGVEAGSDTCTTIGYQVYMPLIIY